MSNASAELEPPKVPNAIQPEDSVNTYSEWADWVRDTLGSDSYGATRVYDLFTLLAVTLAFAVLYGMLRLLEPLLFESLPTIAVTISAFVSLTALAQAVFWEGRKPRVASLLAGPAIWYFLGLALIVQQSIANVTPTVLFLLGLSSIFGVFAGYLSGAMVGGVFLIADVIRDNWMSPSDDVLPGPDIWEDNEIDESK